ncbi:hypothetical protein IWZ03DRAFT_382145 [Phyllosticta citriasiana]|uniref:Uncharacterized protein n=2 Tax=Phyllosticta citriasiana TaxID=595635 RepID=A0ABR1KIB0_9PEZI
MCPVSADCFPLAYIYLLFGRTCIGTWSDASRFLRNPFPSCVRLCSHNNLFLFVLMSVFQSCSFSSGVVGLAITFARLYFTFSNLLTFPLVLLTRPFLFLSSLVSVTRWYLSAW